MVMEVRRAMEGYQYCERIKSELIISLKLLEKMGMFKKDELTGVMKLTSSFLEASLAEAIIAYRVIGSRSFLETSEGLGGY